MTSGMYFSILATICFMRCASKHVAFGMWVVFIGLAVASKLGWL
jgi:hypothetical protein